MNKKSCNQLIISTKNNNNQFILEHFKTFRQFYCFASRNHPPWRNPSPNTFLASLNLRINKGCISLYSAIYNIVFSADISNTLIDTVEQVLNAGRCCAFLQQLDGDDIHVYLMVRTPRSVLTGEPVTQASRMELVSHVLHWQSTGFWDSLFSRKKLCEGKHALSM